MFKMKKQVVHDVLMNNPTTRDNDMTLIWEVWRVLHPDFFQVHEGQEYIATYKAGFLDLTPTETIRRARQWFMSPDRNGEYDYLHGTKQKRRQEMGKEVRLTIND